MRTARPPAPSTTPPSPASGAERPGDATRFALFSVLLAWAVVLDHAQIGTRVELGWGGLSLGAAVLTLLAPWSARALAVLLLAQGALFWSKMPDVENLGFLYLVLSATCLAGLAATWLRHGGGRVSGAAWLASVAPAIRLELLVVYAWAFWHKLNWGFLDPRSTCAVSLYEGTRWVLAQLGAGRLPLPAGAEVAPWLIAGTLAAEGGVPVLLLLRRTRTLGFVIALGFHLFLGLGNFYAFSAAATALLLLFAPAELTARLERCWDAGSARDRRRYRLLAAAGVLCVVAARLGQTWHPGRSAARNLAAAATIGNRFGQLLFLSYVPLVAWALGHLRARSRLGLRELVLPPLPALLVFPLATALNGASPYLGLKTEYSFAMYSNLRTEQGSTNHVVPLLLEVAPYQRDIVRVLASTEGGLAKLAERRTSIPFQELHRRVQRALQRSGKDLGLSYERRGRVHVVPSARADPLLGRPLSLVEKKVLRFREIPFESQQCCH